MPPDDITDSELLRVMYREVTILGERMAAHLKFHTDVVRALVWISGSAVSLAGLAVAARAAGII